MNAKTDTAEHYLLENEGVVGYIMKSDTEKKIENFVEKLDEQAQYILEQYTNLREENKNTIRNIRDATDVLKLLMGKDTQEIKEMARILAEGRNAMAETKGKVEQMDKRIDDNNAQVDKRLAELVSTRRWATGIFTGIGLTIIGLLAKIAFWNTGGVAP